MRKLIVTALVALGLVSPAFGAEEIGIFETVYASSVSFVETTAALDKALAASEFDLHAVHDVRVPEDAHQARVYVLTSPTYAEAASTESPRTVSAQVLRVAVYTSGDEQRTFVNMANPVAHAMVYYAESVRYADLIAAAEAVAESIRTLVTAIPGEAMSVQAEPRRPEKRYNKFNGDGPARTMAKFRKWEKSQREILEDTAANFDSVTAAVLERIAASDVIDAQDTAGWDLVSTIRLRDDVVHIGLTNPYIEDRMIGINSRFRDAGKSENSPYPGVDHVAALPTEVLIVREGERTRVLHYGQMWRMQLYFWDSGYRAFTANMGVPGNIMGSIEDTIETD